MDSSSLVRAVALLARIQPLLIVLSEEKEFYKNLLEKNEQSQKNDFLIQKTISHQKELARITCMIEELLYPECRKEQEDPEGILDYLSRNEGIKKKILEKIKESQPVS